MPTERTRIRDLDLREWDSVGGLLHMVSSFGGRKGCDDFDFARYTSGVENRRDVMKRFHTYNGDPREFNPEGDFHFEHAWVLAALYAEQVSSPEYLHTWEFRLIAALLRHGASNFDWEGTPLSEEFARLMRGIAERLWTEDAAILALE